MKRLVIVLIGAVVVNTIVHWYFAPYTQYQDNFKNLYTLVVSSNNNLRHELTDLVYNSVSSRLSRVEGRLTLVESFDHSIVSPQDTELKGFSVVPSSPFSPSARTFQAGQFWYIYDKPFTWRAGEICSAGTIEKIFKGAAQINGRLFYLSNGSAPPALPNGGTAGAHNIGVINK